MALVELAVLITQETIATIYQKSLDVLTALGVDTESWQSGDPTRSELYAFATLQQAKEDLVTGAIRGGFFDTAEDNWLKLHGAKNYNVPIREAAYAGCTCRVTNSSGELHTFEIGDIVSASGTGATYAVSALPSGDTLASPNGSTLDFTVTAEEAGSASSAAPGDIDTIVSPSRANVAITNTTAAVGTDEEEPEAYRTRARGKLSALSPNGPKGVYDFIATTPEYNGGANVTRTRTVGNSTNGTSTTYCANDSGAASGPDVALVQDAFDGLGGIAAGEPIGFAATAAAAANLTVAVTYTLWVYDSINLTSAEIEALVETELAAAIRRRPIGGDILTGDTTGSLWKDTIEGAIMQAVRLDGIPYGFRCSVATPSGDTAMTISQVAVLGTVTPTINIVRAP